MRKLEQDSILLETLNFLKRKIIGNSISNNRLHRLVSLPFITAIISVSTAMTSFAGWKQIDGAWYFFNSYGIRLAGEQLVDGKAYTFDPDGRMLYEGIHRDGLDLMNQERAKVGAQPLALDYDMSFVAMYRAAHMDKYNYAGHYYNGICVVDQVWQIYTKSNQELAEIIYCLGCMNTRGKGTVNNCKETDFAQEAHNAYLNSPSHYEIMVIPELTHTGVSLYTSKDGKRDISNIVFY